MQITVLKSTVDSALPTITRIMYDKDAVNPLFYKFFVKSWDGCDIISIFVYYIFSHPSSFSVWLTLPENECKGHKKSPSGKKWQKNWAFSP